MIYEMNETEMNEEMNEMDIVLWSECDESDKAIFNKDYFYWRHSSTSTLSILWLHHTRKKTLSKIKTMIVHTNACRSWWNI